MARKETALTKDTTQTSGTGTYTLDGTTANGYQTLAQAVARGLAANGDTIVYRVSDPSDPVVYEVGIGTIGSAGLTVSRDEIKERDDGSTSPASWPSGGVRNFVVTWWPGEYAKLADNGSGYTGATFAANLGLPLLAAGNTFTLAQDANTIEKVVNAHSGVSAAAVWQTQSDAAAASLISNGSGRTTVRFGASIGSRNELLGVTGGLTVGTLGAENVVLGTNGALVAQITAAGVFQNASGNKYDAFPAGTPLQFGAAPPTGWTRVNKSGNRFVKLADTADTPGATGASVVSGLTASTTVNGHANTAAESPALSSVAGSAQSGAGVSPLTSVAYGVAGTAHSHTATTTINHASATALPSYEIWVAATKN